MYSLQKGGEDILIGETDVTRIVSACVVVFMCFCQQTCLEEVLARRQGEPFDLYLVADNPYTHANVRPLTGKLHIYKPSVASVLPNAVRCPVF